MWAQLIKMKVKPERAQDLADFFDGPPEFVDLTVLKDVTP